jgi:DNA-directed RNA polymerase specialized sigma24 family protein
MVEMDDNVSADDLLVPVDEPQHAYALDEWAKRVDKVCSRMKERDAAILKLYFIYGHKAVAVAQLLDTKLPTVLRVIYENRKRIVVGGC